MAKGDATRAVYEITKFWREASKLHDPILEKIFIKNFSAKGGTNKKGHEGILKRAIRDVIESGAKDFDTMLAALEFQVLIAEIDDNKVTYIKPDETLKNISMDAVKKAYREIIKNS